VGVGASTSSGWMADAMILLVGAFSTVSGARPRSRDVSMKGGHTVTRRLVVGGAIVDDLSAPTLLLAARRTRPPALAGYWELPGGKVEPGEDAPAALLREIAEELNVEVALGAEVVPVDGGSWPVSAGWQMRVWWCSIRSGAPTITEGHDALQWLRSEEVARLRWLPGDVGIVARLRADLVPSG
jgi:8-oxo-dGTP diphosphatase